MTFIGITLKNIAIKRFKQGIEAFSEEAITSSISSAITFGEFQFA